MTSVGEHIQKLELSHIGVKGIKMVQPFGQNWEALKQLKKKKLPTAPSNSIILENQREYLYETCP